MTHTSSFIRTDKAIMQAFIELLKEKTFEKITVQDILEKTPVTRATFYAHYRDKHDIAEKMQAHFFEIREMVRLELSKATLNQFPQIIKKYCSNNKELTQALLKIHTDTVDLRQRIVEEFINEYINMNMNTTNDKNTFIEARIYAQARTEIELSQLVDGSNIIAFKDSNDIFLNVALRLLRLSSDKEATLFLKKKVHQLSSNDKEAMLFLKNRLKTINPESS